MPDTVLDARIRAAWHARAAAASLAVGAQIFATGAGVCMSISLNAAYLSVLPCLPLAALTAALARWSLARRLASTGREARGLLSRALLIVLAVLMLACSALLLAAVSSLAGQSLLSEARVSSAVTLTLAATVLCALSGGTGVSRLAYALRFLLPLGLCVLSLLSMSFDSPVGLFPLLGPGAWQLGVSALCALGACTPAALLFLPPPELEKVNSPPDSLPGAWFFVGRILLGALAGTLLLLVFSLCNTYESMETLSVWGDRMHILCSHRPREGLAQTMLVLIQLMCLFLGAVCTLCAAEHACRLAFPALRRHHTGLLLCVLALAAALYALAAFGVVFVLRAAPLYLLPLLVLLLLCRWL